MRFLTVLTAATFTLLSIAESALALDLRTRKAGLWEVTLSMEGGEAPGESNKPQTMKQCIDKETDAKMQQTGTEMVEKMGGKCTKNTLTKTAAGFEGVADCKFAGTHMVSKSTFTGDFQTSYTGHVDATYNPPLMGQSSARTTISGKWLGECEAGMVAGDMVMENGMKMNMNDIGKLGAKVKDAESALGEIDDKQLKEMLGKNRSKFKGMNAEQLQEMLRQQQPQ